ncbi:MAG: hypothetical protein HOP12_03785 [Candidatus Eisenbacteria bacterium]|uniref:Activator of Hsp90 ATPase homologue 1/2-like C-terminal domain-containing protein n=1 Tax=Eiseniibacteriota bacterium TaxID=2212470 RepID=A0A849SD31_UNCEI|nr:hypothetical protein [Candidatus Eisenbacteria bacterium]
MSTESFRVSAHFPVPPERAYRAWLDAREHGLMTGGRATVEPTIGGKITSWDLYITGMILQLEPARRILQTWRTTEFPDEAADSRLEVLFEPEGLGTRVTLNHSDLPMGQGDKYEDGWIDYYFEPMQRYFRRLNQEAVAAAAPPAAATPKLVVAKPVASKPAPVAKKPAARKPTAKKPAAKKPAARKPAAKKPAAKKPAKKKVAKRKAAKRRPVKKAARKAARKPMRKAARKRAVARKPAKRKAAKRKPARKKK